MGLLYWRNSATPKDAPGLSFKNMYMQSHLFTLARLLPLALLASIGVSGCATSASAPADRPSVFDPEKRAVERSAARWKALTDKRFNDSFGYLSEASRVGTNAGEYASAMQRMGFVAAVVEGAKCEDGVCTVKSNVTLPISVRNVGPRLQTLPVEERWIVNNGELWLIRR